MCVTLVVLSWSRTFALSGLGFNIENTAIIEPGAMSSDFPFSVRSINLVSFSVSAGGGAVFLLCFCPYSREGNFGLHSTRFNYSGFCGTERSND